MDTPHRDPSDETTGQEIGYAPEGGAPPATPYPDPLHSGDPGTASGHLQGSGMEYGPAPGYDASQQMYAQGAPPPGRKGGFNWIACCGIGCGVVLVIGIVAGIIIWKTAGSLVTDTMGIVKVSAEVEGADMSQVAAGAMPVTAEQLSLAPDAYRDQWLAFEGTVTSDPDPSHSIPDSGSMEGTAYFVEPNIIVMDTSKTPAIATGGDLIQCIGKMAVMDFSKIGGVGDDIEEEMKKSGELGGQSKMIFVITKTVVVVAEGEGLTDLPADAATDGEAAPASDDSADAAGDGSADASAADDAGADGAQAEADTSAEGSWEQ